MKRLLIIVISFLLFIPPIRSAKAVENGRLIKMHSNNAVYFEINGKRYAFPNEKIYFSWYANFESVITVSAKELSNFPLIGNITYRPGRQLVKIQTDPKVYAVSRYGILHWIVSEQLAIALYGADWARNVQDIPETFFLNYQISTPIQSVNDYSVQTELSIAQLSQNIAESDTTAVIDSLEQKTFELINRYRQSKNLSALVWNNQIATVARNHSINMATKQVDFGHDGFSDRVLSLSKTMMISTSAENVSYNNGYDDPVTIAVEGWLNSSGHLANINNDLYNQTGVGIDISADGSYYFTQIFIKSTPDS